MIATQKGKFLSKKILIAAGGTGGHIFPALAIAKLLLEKNQQIVFLADSRFKNYEKYYIELLDNPKFQIKWLSFKKGTTPSLRSRLLLVPKVFIETLRLAVWLRKNKIDLVVGFGSYVSLTAIGAAVLALKPSLLHEQNSCMGLGNRISIFFSILAMTSFPQTHLVPWLMRRKVIFTGMPVREEIKKSYYQNNIQTINYSAFFKIYDKINILVIGGSQGAMVFKDFVPLALSKLGHVIKKKLIVYHQCNEKSIWEVRQLYENYGIAAVVQSFFNNVSELMSSSHLMIARSGASTIAEISIIGIPTILIPYPYATNNHQLKNALYLHNNGAAILLDQKQKSADAMATKIYSLINDFFNDEEKLYELHLHAKQLAKIDADTDICSIILKILNIDSPGDSGQIIDNNRIIHSNIGLS